MQHEEPLLAERQITHGDIRDNAECYADLLEVVKKHMGSQLALNPQLMYPLHMMLMKLMRIITGDCTFDDHWDDVSGYSLLGKKLTKSVAF